MMDETQEELMERAANAAARAGAAAAGQDPDAMIPAAEAGLPAGEGVLVPVWQAYIRQARITLAMVGSGMDIILQAQAEAGAAEDWAELERLEATAESPQALPGSPAARDLAPAAEGPVDASQSRP
jgi:hypothetical protein